MNAREAAYKALNRILNNAESSDIVLAELSPQVYEQDQSLFYTLVKGTIKQKLHLDFLLSHFISYEKTKEDMMILLLLGIYQTRFLDSVPDYAAVNETIKLGHKYFSKKTCAFANAVLRSYLRKKNNIEYPHDKVKNISVHYSFPQYLITQWIGDFGEDNTIKMCEFFNKPSRLTIRLETNKVTPDTYAKHLNISGIGFMRSSTHDNIFKITSDYNFTNDEFFIKGYIYIQDESTLLPVELLDPHVNETILDMCAAPGGKSLYLASLTNDKAQITAVDNDQERMNFFKNNLKRMPHRSINLVKKDVLYFSETHTFDKILLDAPCTGWGVLQKKPELRIQSQKRLETLIPLQQKLLDKANTLLKKDGYLVYSTCTINSQENEKQIDRFLTKYTNYIIEKPDKFVEKNFVTGNYIKTYPFKHKMDGSFAVRLRKTA
ncbi:MAG TPA: 16S rRNA (cytosine(967)-C(5))-methyltransferase RsmB [Candidatus Cloacimonetes bacterium]|nr:16S rRNA (cytosine(967)-C(5))-methyltransferase RsmB [Candidatus Cloacimonadota bacterium]HEX37407.1 16S rRNA (cytosine(967)-C(5))-methyltransferase RsmB [Candidatus Cloacimonadota bacterium]